MWSVSYQLTLRPSEHRMEDSGSLRLAPYLSHILHFFPNPTLQKHSIIVSVEICSQVMLNNRTAFKADMDFLNQDFVLLISAIVTLYYNICWQYCNFTAHMTPWSEV